MFKIFKFKKIQVLILFINMKETLIKTKTDNKTKLAIFSSKWKRKLTRFQK